MKSLKKHGFDAAAIHGDLDQKVRMRTLDGFRNGEIKLLVASDVAARGLDIPNVSHVFNYDVPIHSEDYVHRIGRTGRAGRAGWAVMLCLAHEEKYLTKIEELVQKTIPRIDPPKALSEYKGKSKSGGKAKDSGKPKEDSKDEKPARKSREVSRKSKPKDAADRAESREAPAPKDDSSKKDTDARNAKRGKGDRGKSSKGGKPVVGMGDHVPAFIMQDFPVIKKSPKTDESDATEDDDSSDESAA